MADARSLVARVFPHNQVGLALGKRGTTTILSVYNLHLACLFPQHGRGIKHKRPIVLEQWQEARSKPHRGLSFGAASGPMAAHYQSHRAVRVAVLWVRNYSEDILKLFAQPNSAFRSGGLALPPIEVHVGGPA